MVARSVVYFEVQNPKSYAAPIKMSHFWSLDFSGSILVLFTLNQTVNFLLLIQRRSD